MNHLNAYLAALESLQAYGRVPRSIQVKPLCLNYYQILMFSDKDQIL